MYKCSECGCEFKTKPDYCDCGNDTFEEIASDKDFNTVNTREYNSVLKKNLPSIIFLIFCIVLSFIILFFIGNPKDNPVQNEVAKTPENITVADINDIWNDEKPKQPVIQKPKNDPVISQAKIDNTQPKTETPKKPVIQTPKINKQIQQPVQKPITQKPITQKVQKPVQKPTQKPVSSNQQVKTTSNSKSQQVQKPTQTPKTNPIYKPAQNSQQKAQQQNQTQPKTQTQQQTQTQNTQTQNIQTQKAQTQSTKTVNAEELKQYKKALRSKIASNIDFLSVAGDGKCVLSFNISQSGVLLNRKFVSQSQNTSLNDAVYSAMLQVSSFKAPPAGYRNETMKLTVQISGSNFSVILD